MSLSCNRTNGTNPELLYINPTTLRSVCTVTPKFRDPCATLVNTGGVFNPKNSTLHGVPVLGFGFFGAHCHVTLVEFKVILALSKFILTVF